MVSVGKYCGSAPGSFGAKGIGKTQGFPDTGKLLALCRKANADRMVGSSTIGKRSRNQPIGCPLDGGEMYSETSDIERMALPLLERIEHIGTDGI